jgi:hypothetical protein
MSARFRVEFDTRPSALGFMLNALHPSPGLSAAQGLPPILARWRQHRVDQRELEDFLALTGLSPGPYLPVIYPHVSGFRLQMVVLTHPRFPLPIWGALQVRNHLLQHRPLPRERPLDLETRTASLRILEKGVEIDLHMTVSAGGELVWESLNTFYYRGRFGEAGAPSPWSNPPPAPTATVAEWRLPAGVDWRLARMTGDYNGIHHWHWYARRFGFRRAFFHPQMIAGQCMAHVQGPHPEQPQQLKLWLRGPAYFEADVSLRAGTVEGDCAFALMLRGEERAAMLGRWGPARISAGLSD